MIFILHYLVSRWVAGRFLTFFVFSINQLPDVHILLASGTGIKWRQLTS